MEGIIKAKKIGNIDAVEIDARLTKDNILVVFHDRNAKRLLNIDKEISELTLKEVQSVYIQGSQFKVPTLDDVLKIIKKYNMKIEIDMKTWGRPYIAAKNLKVLFNKYDLYNQAFVSAFNPITLYMIRYL